ncbi:MAG: cation:proton antiporter [Alphaproteobacteria bacterium]
MTMSVLDVAIIVSIFLVLLGAALVVFRVIVGPGLPDRSLGLDALTTLLIAFMALIALEAREFAYLDVAIGLGLIGFLATVALARFIETRALDGDRRIADDARFAEDREQARD